MENSIERTIDLKASVDRVWTALTDYEEFGAWFRLELDGPFQVGRVTTGVVNCPGHEGLPFWARVTVMEAPRRFSFVWPMDESVDPDDPDIEHKVTLVDFTLEPLAEGARLTVRESGFERLPADKRLQVFRDNNGGWDFQMKNIRSHVE
jgi:uncharacterized protein YndB with AHSA1/START domain